MCIGVTNAWVLETLALEELQAWLIDHAHPELQAPLDPQQGLALFIHHPFIAENMRGNVSPFFLGGKGDHFWARLHGGNVSRPPSAEVFLLSLQITPPSISGFLSEPEEACSICLVCGVF